MQIPVVWTCDDLTAGELRELEEVSSWLEKLGIPGTFFCIPARNGGLDKDTEFLASAKGIMAKGSEFHPHGYDHWCFECGIPDTSAVWTSRHSWEIQEEFNLNRFEIEQAHTREAIRNRLHRGFEIWQRAFGKYPTGFRPGFGSFCRNLYYALEDLQVPWCSIRFATPTAMQWSRGPQFYDVPEKIYPQGFAPFKVGNITEYPFAGDYGYHIPPEAVDRFVELGWRQFNIAADRGDPFIMLAHQHGLACTDNPPTWANAGYESHEKLIRRIRDSGKARFITMSELHAIQTGKIQ